MYNFDKGQKVIISHGTPYWDQKTAIYVGKTPSGLHEVKAVETGETAFFDDSQLYPIPCEYELAEVVSDFADTCVEVDRLRAQAVEQADKYQKAREFVERINAELNDTADRFDWCSEYEDKLAYLNQFAPFDMQLEGRSQDFEIDVEFTVTVNFTRTVVVNARSFDDAVEEIENDEDVALGGETIEDLAASEMRYVCVSNWAVSVI